MVREFVALLALAVSGGPAAAADTIQLRDKAAVTGTILVEKPDQVVVDIGYTVLSIPRSQVVTITRSKDGAGDPAGGGSTDPLAAAKLAPGPKTGFYFTPGRQARLGNVRDFVNQFGEAVVQVRTPAGLGSGFIINEDGFLMTNFHVIEGETQITVEVYHQKGGELERRTYNQVRIFALNKFADLALLKIEDKGAPRFKHVVLGSAEGLNVGDRVFAIGSPLGLERTVTEGILSSKARPMGGELYLQTTAQINLGNSGGPLFNLRGEVIGVTNMKITFGEGLGFAIPAESVRFFLDHREAFAYSSENPSNPYHYLPPPSRARNPATNAEE
jgi:serine protease Do